MTINPVIPPSWIVALAVVASVATLWTHWRAGRRVGRWRNGILNVMRLVAILAVVALLLQPSREERITPPSVERSLLFAIDSSASMSENDAEGVRRIDRAVEALEQAGILDDEANLFRFYQFDGESRYISASRIRAARAFGPETRFHSSLRKMLRSHSGAPPAGLVILSDGHDHEAIPPGQTAQLAH